MDNKERYLLALLLKEDQDGESGVKGKTWLQKIMYMAFKDCPEMEWGFTRHKYGMFSQALDDLITSNVRQGLMRTGNSGGREPILLTKKGRDVASKNISDCSHETLNRLVGVKSLLNPLSYNELIAYTYTKYPEMLTNSDNKEIYPSTRLDAAISMFKAERISFGLACKIAGMNRDEFGDHLMDLGIYAYAPEGKLHHIPLAPLR